MIFRCIACLFILVPAAVSAAEVRVDQYDQRFNAAADKVGLPFRLAAPSCAEHRCNYVGDQRISADAVADKPRALLRDSVLRVPLTISNTEFAAVILTMLQMFSPESSAEARQTFAISLSQQLARDGTRAEGRLGKWVYVLRHDPGERWRVVVRKPDA